MLTVVIVKESDPWYCEAPERMIINLSTIIHYSLLIGISYLASDELLLFGKFLKPRSSLECFCLLI